VLKHEGARAGGSVVLQLTHKLPAIVPTHGTYHRGTKSSQRACSEGGSERQWQRQCVCARERQRRERHTHKEREEATGRGRKRKRESNEEQHQ
jgi:hypothetical protein